jgi:hypothetical protein
MLRLGLSEFIDGGISHYEHFENIFNDGKVTIVLELTLRKLNSRLH